MYPITEAVFKGLGLIKEDTESQEVLTEASSSEIIRELIKTKWSADNDAQMKAVQLLKGIALSDEDAANKFMKAIDKFTSGLNPDDF